MSRSPSSPRVGGRAVMVWTKRFVQLLFAFPVAATLVDSVGGISTVHGASMQVPRFFLLEISSPASRLLQPTFNPHRRGRRDVVWLNKWFAWTGEPERGEIVVYTCVRSRRRARRRVNVIVVFLLQISERSCGVKY